MNKEFIPYEQALALKELGFDEPSISGYSYPNSDKLLSQAILYQQAFRWFREKYDINFTIITNYAKIDLKTIKSYRVGIITVNGNKIDSFFLRPENDKMKFIEFKTHEEAELECLIKLIEIVKN
jgi:hypothetical protein